MLTYGDNNIKCIHIFEICKNVELGRQMGGKNASDTCFSLHVVAKRQVDLRAKIRKDRQIPGFTGNFPPNYLQ